MSTGPVYLRVLEDLRAQIRDGVLAPGARVPSRNAIIARAVRIRTWNRLIDYRES